MVPHNHRLQPRQPFALPATQQDDADAAVSPDITSAVALFAAVPVGALILQGLYAQRVLLPLLLVKRVYMYAMAAYVVAVGGARGGADPSALGTRLESLTREVLPDSLAPTADLAPLQKLDAVDETGNLLERGAHAYVARHFHGGILKGGDRLGGVVLFVHEALGERGDEHDE